MATDPYSPNGSKPPLGTRLPLPTSRGVLVFLAAIFILVVGTRSRNAPATLIGAVVLGFLAASAYLAWRGVQGIAVQRDTTIRGQVGNPIPFSLQVRAPGALGGFLIAKDRNFGVKPTLVSTRDGEYSGSWLLMLTQRGKWSELHTAIASSMPAGLFVARKELSAPADVEIGPATADIDLPEIMGPVEGVGEKKSRPPKAGRGIDYLGIREYRQGDRIRHIHWRASARHNELLVREFEVEGRSKLVVALDTQGYFTSPAPNTVYASGALGDLMTVTPAAPSVSLGDFPGERSVTVAASISIAALREGHEVWLLSGVGPAKRIRSREEALSYWAKVSFGNTPPVTKVLGSVPPRARVAVVGTGRLLPFLEEMPESGTGFVVGPPIPVPRFTYFVPVDGPLIFLEPPNLADLYAMASPAGVYR